MSGIVLEQVNLRIVVEAVVETCEGVLSAKLEAVDALLISGQHKNLYILRSGYRIKTFVFQCDPV